MIPAPGLMALVESPVSQLLVEENPMASWHEPAGEATLASTPIVTLKQPLPIPVPERNPIAILQFPVVFRMAWWPTATLSSPMLRFVSALTPTATFPEGFAAKYIAPEPTATLFDPVKLRQRAL
jgi:hypothetical protein